MAPVAAGVPAGSRHRGARRVVPVGGVCASPRARSDNNGTVNGLFWNLSSGTWSVTRCAPPGRCPSELESGFLPLYLSGHGRVPVGGHIPGLVGPREPGRVGPLVAGDYDDRERQGDLPTDLRRIPPRSRGRRAAPDRVGGVHPPVPTTCAPPASSVRRLRAPVRPSRRHRSSGSYSGDSRERPFVGLRGHPSDPQRGGRRFGADGDHQDPTLLRRHRSRSRSPRPTGSASRACR